MGGLRLKDCCLKTLSLAKDQVYEKDVTVDGEFLFEHLREVGLCGAHGKREILRSTTHHAPNKNFVNCENLNFLTSIPIIDIYSRPGDA